MKPSTKYPPYTETVNPRDYHGMTAGKKGTPDFLMSRSELREFARCPERWLELPPMESTDAMKWGSLVDCAVLTPHLFESQYVVSPATYEDDKGKAKPWNYNATVCKEWREEKHRAGMEVMKPKDAELLEKAIAKLKSNAIASQFITACNKQVQVCCEYHDAATGIVVQLKAMLDLVPKGDEFGDCIADFKTADCAEPSAWQRAVINQGYHYQSALYLDMFNAATGENRSQFAHIIQESSEPFVVARRVLSREFIEYGRQQYRRDLINYCRCLSENRFPGYDDEGTIEVSPPIIDGWRITEPPAWMLAQM